MPTLCNCPQLLPQLPANLQCDQFCRRKSQTSWRIHTEDCPRLFTSTMSYKVSKGFHG